MRDRRWLALEAVLSVFGWAAVLGVTAFFTLCMAVVACGARWWDPDRERCHRIASLWGRSLIRLHPGVRVEVSGRENLPADRPVLLVANHLSYSDIPVLSFLKHSFRWMANEELFRIPLLGWSMRMAGYIPVRRGQPGGARRAAEAVRRLLGRGTSVILFPEGTRARAGLFGKFHFGGFRLAVTTGTPIVPVVVVGTRQLLPRGSAVFAARAWVRIHVLPAVTPKTGDLTQVRGLARSVKSQMVRVYRREIQKRRRDD